MGTSPGSAAQTPVQFAEEIAGIIVDAAESLGLVFVTFAGRRANDEANLRIAFETLADLQSAGFTLLIDDPRAMISPRSVPAVSQQDLFEPACRTLSAFLTLYANNSAGINLKPPEAAEFGRNLPSLVATRCAGQFGFPESPREAFGVLGNIIPAIVHTAILNQQSFGVNDCLGDILNHISLSGDGKARYGFVAGSEAQAFGCGNRLVAVTAQISQRIHSFASSRETP